MTKLPHSVIVYSAKGGVGCSTAAVAFALLTQASHADGHTVLADYDGRAYDLLGRPPFDPPGDLQARHHRDVHDRLDVVHWPGARFDAGHLHTVLAADPALSQVNALIIDAGRADPSEIARAKELDPSVVTVQTTRTCYLAAAAGQDHYRQSGVAPDDVVVLVDLGHPFSLQDLARLWPAKVPLRGVANDPTVPLVIDAGLLGLTTTPGHGIFPDALAALQPSPALPHSADRRLRFDALNASSPDTPQARALMRHWTEQLSQGLDGPGL